MVGLFVSIYRRVRTLKFYDPFTNVVFELPGAYIGYIWLIVGIALLFAELGSPGLFFFIAFAIGCFVAAPLAFLEYPFALQCVVALVVSLVSFAVIKRFFAAKFTSGHGVKTNVKALIGRKGVVLDIVDDGRRAYVKIRGEVWPAKGEKWQVLHKGKRVEVIRVQGNHLIVCEIS